MRVDGSVKTITAGVTTLDDKRHSGIYAKQVNNFRCDPDRGLTTRPPAQYVAKIWPDFRAGTDAIFPFTLDSSDFWCIIVPDGGESEGMHRLHVFTADGVEEEVIHNKASSYFDNIRGTPSVAHVAIGDSLYIANRNRRVFRSDLEEIRTTHSMVVLKQAPAPLSVLEVTWTDGENNQKKVTLTVPEDTADTGTNTMAAQLAVLIAAAQPTGDTAFVKGSTISIVRADGEYSSVSCTDGANDAVMASLNDETQDINNLPKYAPHESVVKIRPDKGSDRGQFWMRAQAYVDADETPLNYPEKKQELQLVADTVLNMGYNDWIDQGLVILWGYQRFDIGQGFPPIGSMTPATIQGVNVNEFIWHTGKEVDQSHLYITLAGPLPSPDDFTYILVVETTSGNVVYESQVARSDNTTYMGIRGISKPLPFVQGRNYDVFYEFIDDFYGALPEVVWQEAADPGQLNNIDVNTMPHVLGRLEDGTFITAPMTEMGLQDVRSIRSRMAGDNETNPMPHFIDHTIQDLGRFQERLVVLSNDSVTMSVTDKPYAWFRETVTQQLSTDPIGLRSAAQNAAILRHIVTHNNDALIFSDTAQYKLLGAVGMTSQNASLTQTTNYDNTGRVKPDSNGSDVFFTTAYNENYSGLSRFSIDKEADSQDIAISLTNHVQDYIEGECRYLQASTSLNIVVGRFATLDNVLYVFEYRETKNDPQAAWSKWILPPEVHIRNIALTSNNIRLAIEIEGDVYLATISVNQITLPGFNTVLHLDLGDSRPDVDTTFDITDYPWDDDLITLYQGPGAWNPGDEIHDWSREGNVVTVPDMNGGTVIFGIKYRSEFMPARRWIRDDSGTPQTASKLRITDYGFHAIGQDINVDILDGPETWPTQVFSTPDMENDAYHRVSFKQRHDEADIVISSDHPLGATIRQLEWRGTYFKTGRRF